VDKPDQDFATPSSFWEVVGSGDNDSDRPIGRVPSASLTGAIIEQSAVAHLIGIFGEANRITAKTRLLFGSVRAGTGLTGSEALTLVAVVHATVPPTVPQVGRFLGSPRQVIQRAIKVLERDGFVTLLHNPDHKRAPLLTPTDKGRTTIKAIDAATRKIVAGLAEGAEVAQLGSTHAGLLALREHIDRNLGVEDY
jgi:DNA-binding MarR family transcriptional regulator